MSNGETSDAETGQKTTANDVPAKPATSPRPAGRPAAVPTHRRSPTTLFTGALVGVVLVIVVVLVVLKLTGSSTPASTAPPAQPLPASTAQQVTQIPASVYNTVGVTSPTVIVTPPKVIGGKPPLIINGKPGFLYVGGEFCPYCAAQRWAITAALARFGKFTDLQTMQSSSTDAFGGIQTLTFAGATFSSPYVTASLREYYGNQHNSSGTGWAVLDPPTPLQEAVLTRYDVAKYTGVASTAGSAIPFVDIGNKAFVAGASYSPSILQGLTRTQIASGLNDPKDPVTQAVVASANYLSASVCKVDSGRPASVCKSKGVTEAAAVMGFTP